MDKSILKQYAALLKEFEAEEKRLDELQREFDELRPRIREVADVVTGGRRGKKPLATYKIHGYEDHGKLNKKRVRLRVRKAKKELHLAQIEAMVIDAEEMIYSVPDAELRNIMLYYCVDRKSWDEVAEAMGKGYTAEACKQKFSRFLRSK